MRSFKRTRSRKAGLPPGTLVHVGERRVERASVTVIDYDEAGVRERTVERAEDCRQYVGTSTVTWINVTGLHDVALLEQLGEIFSIHSLVLEDILNTGQRPRLEDLGEALFLVVKMIYRNGNGHEIVSEQVSLILGKNYVLSFQEVEGDVFGMIRDRIRSAKGRIRKMGCDYLLYALLDAIVDNYFVVLEELGDTVELLQDMVIAQPEPKTMQQLHGMKREIVFLRKNLWPLREAVSGLQKTEGGLVGKKLAPYLRDVYEHTIQVIDSIELLRDMLASAQETYMTVVSNRMNEVMKVLTVIATIFIPLTFVAGIYGMNFENMPELKWPFGYAAVWLVMIAAAIGMVMFFKRKKWL